MAYRRSTVGAYEPTNHVRDGGNRVSIMPRPTPKQALRWYPDAELKSAKTAE